MDSVYLDTSVLVTPLLANRPAQVLGACAAWLKRIQVGDCVAFSSFLVWDEAVWIAGKVTGVYQAVIAQEAGRHLLAIPNLKWVDVDLKQIRQAQAFLEAVGANTKPRDCLHAASAVACGADQLVTLDAGFSRFARQGNGFAVTLIGPRATKEYPPRVHRVTASGRCAARRRRRPRRSPPAAAASAPPPRARRPRA